MDTITLSPQKSYDGHIISVTTRNVDLTLPNIYHKEVVSKNGNDIVKYVWVVDTSKPSCWIEGYQYQFNSTLIEVRKVSNACPRG